MTIEGKKHYYDCSVCGSNYFSKIYGVSVFDVCLCHNCGAVCLNPRMSEGEYRDYYSKEYYGSYALKVGVKKSENTSLNNPRGAKIFSDLEKYVTTKSRIIEIGCGNGENLIAFKNMGFNNLTGVEPSLDCFKNLQKIYGIKFFNYSLSEFIDEFNGKKKFDCVILSHMLEHFVEPNKALKSIARIIKPEGILYILVPCLYGSKNPFSQFCIPHTFYFSGATLKTLVRGSGFVLKKCFESPSKDEITMIVKKTSESLICPTNNPREYKKVLAYLKGDKIIYIRARTRRSIEKLVIWMIGERAYLHIRNFLKNIKLMYRT